MNSAYVPPKMDANMVLQAAVTKTATFSSEAIDLGDGFNPGGNGIVVDAGIRITAIDRANADETYTFQLEESDDNVTFTACGLASASQTAVGAFSITGRVSKRYVRVTATLGGNTPSVTYEAWMYVSSPVVG